MIPTQKPYSLDYDNFPLAADRVREVQRILDSLEKPLSNSDLEQLGDYIIYGKDPDHVSPLDTKTVSRPPTRYNSYITAAEKVISLDEMIDGADPVVRNKIESLIKPVAPRAPSGFKKVKPTIHRSRYDADGNLVFRGDDFAADGTPIQAMRDLWDSIDRLERRVRMYQGKEPPDEYVLTYPKTQYQIYQLNHLLISLRNDQVLIKDAYNPAIHFFCDNDSSTEWNFDENTGYRLPDGTWHQVSQNAIDYENPRHMFALMRHYTSLLTHSYGRPASSTRALCFDFEHYVEAAALPDQQQMVLEGLIAHEPAWRIQADLLAEGYPISQAEIYRMGNKVIPRALANAAKRERLENLAATGQLPTKRCMFCGKTLPEDEFFFYRALNNRLSDVCRNCLRRKTHEPKKDMSKV